MMSKPYSGRKKSAIQTSENRILFPVQSPIRSEGPYRRDYSHSIVANSKYAPSCIISLFLLQGVLHRANHFVIGRGDYKMRFLLPFHLICDYSLATTPIFTKGSGHRWFSTGVHAVSDAAIGGCKPCALGGFLPDFCQERKAENILFMG